MNQTKPSAEANEYHYVECGLANVWLQNGFEKDKRPTAKVLPFQALMDCTAVFPVLCATSPVN